MYCSCVRMKWERRQKKLCSDCCFIVHIKWHAHSHAFTINRYFNLFPHRLTHDKYISNDCVNRKIDFLITCSDCTTSSSIFFCFIVFHWIELTFFFCRHYLVYLMAVYFHSVRECVRKHRTCAYTLWNAPRKVQCNQQRCLIGHSNRLFSKNFHLNSFHSSIDFRSLTN